MVTKVQAMTCHSYEHVRLKNADGSPVRCRVNGRCKVWKTRPDDFRLPVKYGLRDCFYLTPANAVDWVAVDAGNRRQVCLENGLAPDTPTEVLHDWLEERRGVQ